MPLDLRQGFFRLWLAFAIFWVAGAGAIAAMDAWHTRNDFRRYAYSRELDQIAPAESAAFPEKVFKEFMLPGTRIALAVPVVPPKGPFTVQPQTNVAGGAFADLIPEPIDYDALARQSRERTQVGPWNAYGYDLALSVGELKGVVQRTRSTDLRSRIWKISGIALLILMPRAAIYLLGTLIAWIGRGFHSK